LDLVSGTNTGDQDLSGIRDTLTFHADSLSVAYDTSAVHNTRLIAIEDDTTNWSIAYTNRITSLTTTGSSGASTLSSNVLNIPQYTLAGLAGLTSGAISTMIGDTATVLRSELEIDSISFNASNNYLRIYQGGVAVDSTLISLSSASGTEFNVSYTGLINSTNTTYDLNSSFSTGESTVYYNGVAQQLGVSYTETDSNTIEFTTAPATGGWLKFDIVKQ